jgi:hypothetical protein
LGRYLLILVIIFLLYWTLKGSLRRFLAPPRRRRSVARPRSKEQVQRGKRGAPGIDYSKIKDADYRDL